MSEEIKNIDSELENAISEEEAHTNEMLALPVVVIMHLKKC